MHFAGVSQTGSKSADNQGGTFPNSNTDPFDHQAACLSCTPWPHRTSTYVVRTQVVTSASTRSAAWQPSACHCCAALPARRCTLCCATASSQTPCGMAAQLVPVRPLGIPCIIRELPATWHVSCNACAPPRYRVRAVGGGRREAQGAAGGGHPHHAGGKRLRPTSCTNVAV